MIEYRKGEMSFYDIRVLLGIYKGGSSNRKYGGIPFKRHIVDGVETNWFTYLNLTLGIYLVIDYELEGHLSELYGGDYPVLGLEVTTQLMKARGDVEKDMFITVYHITYDIDKHNELFKKAEDAEKEALANFYSEEYYEDYGNSGDVWTDTFGDLANDAYNNCN